MINNSSDTKDESDSIIIEKCLHGDTGAFGLLVERYQSRLYTIVCRIMGDRDDAADVLQNVFIKVFENLHSYNTRYKFYSWLYRIAVNESYNFLHYREKMTSLIAASQISVDDSPAERMEKSDVIRNLEEALTNLKTEQRIIIVLKHFGELSYREIAEILDIPEKTVKSRLFSARQELKNLLLKRGDTPVR
jgi:RNA polymerase sigma-70 factor, ECF subfamily